MSAVLILALTNAVLATGMFAVVAACKSRIHNPAVMHCLWILVLLKLLTPPLWCPQLALLPAVEPAAELAADTTVSRHTNPGVASDQQLGRPIKAQPFNPVQPEGFVDYPAQGRVPDSDARPDGWRRAVAGSVSPLLLLVIVWGAGTVLLWGLSVWRISRLQRCLRFAQEAPVEVQQTTALLAEQLGLRRCPRVWQVPGRVSPMLWTFVGPARIVVPRELFSELEGPARRTLLLHELVHYRRGDQWIRWLELVSRGLYWWHPVAWLLRREIRLAEELACDARVVSHSPNDRRAYAEMLVKTVAFLSSDDLPSLATGVVTKGSIEERLRKIMHAGFDVRVSRRMKVVVGLMAILFLPLAPILVRAQRALAKTSAERQTTATASGNSDDAVKAIGNQAERVDELLGTVVNETGKTVAGAEVRAFLEGQRVDRVIKTNESGQFRAPRSWRPDDRRDSHAVLLVRQGDSGLGWLNLGSLLMSGSAKQTPATANDSFRIVLWPRTQTVRGTLVDSDGKPLSHIRVAVDWLTDAANHAVNQYAVGDEELGSATTDRNGTFMIRLPEGARGSLEPHDLDWQRTRITIKPETRDLGRIMLARAGRIQGRVVDAATGKPLASQQVLAQAQDTSQVAQGFVSFGWAVTDREGKYAIGGLSPGKFNVLFGGGVRGSAEQPSLTALAVEGVDVSVARPVQADFLASTGRLLSGKVLDSDSGNPLAKIFVGYYGPARPNSGAACLMVRTNADGSFEFHVPPGVSRIYVAEGDRGPHSESSRTLEVPADRDLVDVVLQAGQKDASSRTVQRMVTAETKDTAQADKVPAPDDPRRYKLHVTLQTPAGRKVNRVEARVVHEGSQRTSQWVALSATGNEISFHRREDGLTTFLLIDAGGYATARSAEFVVRERMPNLAVELVPEVPAPVRGRVVDQAGKAVEGARVRIARLIYGSQQTFPWGLEYTTGNDGRFEIKQARIGDRIQVRIDKPGTGGAESDWMSLEGKEPRILPDLRVGPPDQEVGGVVRDYDGFAVENAKVIHTGEPRVETTTAAEGKFRLTGLPTGSVSLTIESAGFPRDVRQARTGKLDNEIHVNRIGVQDENDYQVTVTLRPRDGKEVPRATLFFCAENGDLLMIMPERKGNTHKIGFAQMVRRNKGKQFAVVIAADGYARSKPVIVPNQKGPQAIVIDLEPADPVTLRGSVVDDAGRPVADAKIGLSISLNDRAADEPWRYINSREELPLTDVDGKFAITGILRNSRVAVYVNKPGYSGVWSDRVTTEKPDNVELPTLRLSPATGELSGRVVDEQGRPVLDAAVSVHDLGRIVTNTDAQGRFRLQRVPNKEIWLRVQAESGEWTQKITPDVSDLNVKLQTRQ
jgi:beta-lactamase regulating signal transducer with metallopeptidase domain/protocatechuate 3,4-dioxygenase beta subunit